MVLNSLDRSNFVIVLTAAILAMTLIVPVSSAQAAQTLTQSDTAERLPVALDAALPAALSKFDPSTIIDDELFFNASAMSAAEIQAFLNQKIGSCRNESCLNILRASFSSRDRVQSGRTGRVICERFSGGSMLVAEAIYRLQVACGISAAVVLVMLQKEQGLVTSKAPSAGAIRAAMGANCPDTAPCDPAHAGIGPQLVAGITQLKTYRAAGFARQPGRHFMQYSPTSTCGGSTIVLSNYATAALYNYTPYQPNAAALTAGYGVGDKCSSYGNRNFFNYYTDWFGPTTGQSLSPVGIIKDMWATEDGIALWGWALDGDAITTPLQIKVTVGSSTTVWTADQSYDPVAASNPGAGPNHAFGGTVPAPPGTTQRVCVDAVNVGSGKDTSLGCRDVDLPPRVSPRGELKDAWATVEGINMWGWAIDPDAVQASVDLHIQVDEMWFVWQANAPYPLGPTLVAGAGTSHGWGGVIAVAPGQHRVCITMINQGQGANTPLGCRVLNVPSIADVSPKGEVKEVTTDARGIGLWGWAVDPDAKTQPVSVIVQMDSNWYEWRADQPNSTAESLFPGSGPNHGWGGRVDATPGEHWVCVYFRNSGAGADVNTGCRRVVVPAPVVEEFSPKTMLMGAWAVSGAIELWGYAVDPDYLGTPTTVILQIDNTWQELTADASYPPGAGVYPGAGENHGFYARVPSTSGRHWVCTYAVDMGEGNNTEPQCIVVDVP